MYHFVMIYELFLSTSHPIFNTCYVYIYIIICNYICNKIYFFKWDLKRLEPHSNVSHHSVQVRLCFPGKRVILPVDKLTSWQVDQLKSIVASQETSPNTSKTSRPISDNWVFDGFNSNTTTKPIGLHISILYKCIQMRYTHQ